MIRGRCKSNLDEFNRMGDWPTVFANVPMNGDIVESSAHNILKVCRVTHSVRSVHDFEFRQNKGYSHFQDEPFIIVELTKLY